MMKQGKERQKDILKVLKDHGQTVSAYEVLKAIKGSEAKLAALTVHCALSALTKRSATHKFEGSNAFVS